MAQRNIKEGDIMANISQNVNIEMLEKLPDGTYKRKYPKTRSDTGVTFDEHLAESTSYSTYKLTPDSNGIFTQIQYKRKNGTLILKSVLSGGTSPKYTTRTETEYEQNGITVKATRVYLITYTDDKVTSEVLQ